mgnify:CR=1 FL=1
MNPLLKERVLLVLALLLCAVVVFLAVWETPDLIPMGIVYSDIPSTGDNTVAGTLAAEDDRTAGSVSAPSGPDGGTSGSAGGEYYAACRCGWAGEHQHSVAGGSNAATGYRGGSGPTDFGLSGYARRLFLDRRIDECQRDWGKAVQCRPGFYHRELTRLLLSAGRLQYISLIGNIAEGLRCTGLLASCSSAG